jgi:hypothetical protein
MKIVTKECDPLLGTKKIENMGHTVRIFSKDFQVKIITKVWDPLSSAEKDKKKMCPDCQDLE